MATDEAYVKLAERAGHADSKLLHLILEKAMNPEEARFLLELPASNADLAAKSAFDAGSSSRNLASSGFMAFSRIRCRSFESACPARSASLT